MKIGVFCSHGGHLTEAQEIVNPLNDHTIFYVTYNCERTKALGINYLLPNIGTNVFLMIWATLYIFYILFKERPNVIMSTGAEIAIPAFYIAKLFGIYTIFIESLACIDYPSKTGRIVYYVSDVFLVQWESLLHKYGNRAVFKGCIL